MSDRVLVRELVPRGPTLRVMSHSMSHEALDKILTATIVLLC